MKSELQTGNRTLAGKFCGRKEEPCFQVFWVFSLFVCFTQMGKWQYRLLRIFRLGTGGEWMEEMTRSVL